MAERLKGLRIGDLEIKVPIIQGGMGVKVSTSSLAVAVADCGGGGTIAGVGLGEVIEHDRIDPIGASIKSLREEIRQAKAATIGVIGVNIMVALGHFETAVRASVDEKADFIAAGAGLPLKLPEYAEGGGVKLIPIVSSGKAAALITSAWRKRYDVRPDAFIVEGPRAGGHLGFKYDELVSSQAPALEDILADVLAVVEEHGAKGEIPVIPAGGIYDGKDIARFLRAGAAGVQMATRFVTTHECSVADAFKKAYLAATEDDIAIIKSPVGLPGRTLKTAFVKKILRGEKVPFSCDYICLRGCDPATAPYCIADAMFAACHGALDDAVVFCGSNVPRIDKIVSVKELMDELVAEAEAALAAPAEDGASA